MQLGKALLGAIIGAAIGIGLLLAAYLLFQKDNVWLAIPFALITGLGARFLSSTGRASYARGALTMVIALAAYIGGWVIVSKVATAKANAPMQKPPVAAQDAPVEGEPTDEADAETPVETPAVEQPKAAAPRADVPRPRPDAPRAFSTWDFIWLCVAALCAYIVGSGSDSGAVPARQPEEPLPAGTHPDA
jgi:hypothetical protein